MNVVAFVGIGAINMNKNVGTFKSCIESLIAEKKGYEEDLKEIVGIEANKPVAFVAVPKLEVLLRKMEENEAKTETIERDKKIKDGLLGISKSLAKNIKKIIRNNEQLKRDARGVVSVKRFNDYNNRGDKNIRPPKICFERFARLYARVKIREEENKK